MPRARVLRVQDGQMATGASVPLRRARAGRAGVLAGQRLSCEEPGPFAGRLPGRILPSKVSAAPGSPALERHTRGLRLVRWTPAGWQVAEQREEVWGRSIDSKVRSVWPAGATRLGSPVGHTTSRDMGCHRDPTRPPEPGWAPGAPQVGRARAGQVHTPRRRPNPANARRDLDGDAG
jgi:hypothetical protein